jgi:hypothetical protein
VDKPHKGERQASYALPHLQDHILRAEAQETITHIQAVDWGLVTLLEPPQ